MRDFATLLEGVLNEKIRLIETTPVDPVNARIDAAGKPDLNGMIKHLKNFLKQVSEKTKAMDGPIQRLLEAVRTKLGSVKKQFKGLAALSTQQKTHIEEMNEEANRRVKELKNVIKPLADKAGVDMAGPGADMAKKITAYVDNIDDSLRAKQAEMDATEQDYEDLLDYYEGIMVKMKKAEMEAQKALRNAEAEMAAAFDHYDPMSEVNRNERKKQAKRKKGKKSKVLSEQVRNYGTFNLEEHLQKMRDRDGGTKDGADW